MRARECPDTNSREFRTSGPPPGWSFCKRSLNTRGGAIGKISPGVLALRNAAASLEVTLESASVSASTSKSGKQKSKSKAWLHGKY